MFTLPGISGKVRPYCRVALRRETRPVSLPLLVQRPLLSRGCSEGLYLTIAHLFFFLGFFRIAIPAPAAAPAIAPTGLPSVAKNPSPPPMSAALRTRFRLFLLVLDPLFEAAPPPLVHFPLRSRFWFLLNLPNRAISLSVHVEVRLPRRRYASWKPSCRCCFQRGCRQELRLQHRRRVARSGLPAQLRAPLRPWCPSCCTCWGPWS